MLADAHIHAKSTGFRECSPNGSDSNGIPAGRTRLDESKGCLIYP